MDTNQYSEDLFPDTEEMDQDKISKKEEIPTETPDPNIIEEQNQETPDLFLENVPETETFEEPLQLETVEETPDFLEKSPEVSTENNSEPENDEEVLDEEDAEPVDEMEIETPDLDLDADEDVIDTHEEIPIVKPLELRQADFTSGAKPIPPKKDPQVSKLINLPLGRVKSIMKLDPDVRLMSSESIFLISKATEMFIQSVAKECLVQKDPKKKTIQKHDVDQVFASIDALMFLEGAMDF